ncbi:hypothetical protein A2415_04295 [candidate division WWE3 bacterium RIFOXYC1_FULL_39_7]|uniref:ATPase F1/V1/A1 complex alpha/beta subunit nucleotide-binding domain-containing protein n=1 Tax=candidate division WWE3 bacterium RIFOXYC1_FULL_39_7 TaxID=1802643 RepID=A0A1F4WKE4_UNCKA|nr:MAG: hypothetical protein A2415_04295 [candidate division WWE3 bacterium RIFOXYC1_FULL_39_7]
MDFETFLNATGEIGYVRRISSTIVFCDGLPGAKLSEVVIFENGEIGQVFSTNKDSIEIIVLSKGYIKVGTKVARTGQTFKINIGNHLFGNVISPTDLITFEGNDESADRIIESEPLGIDRRKNIGKPFETGVTLVDLMLPLGMGQRELLIGDRKTNKTQFVLQSILTQAQKGTICIYAAIAKKRTDVILFNKFAKNNKIDGKIITIASYPDDPSGLIYLTPYIAMTIAEYFRDRGEDVYLCFDDLTAHAKYYREISLLAGRFPGRNSYPGDIFYLHSRLLERAGNFIVEGSDKKSGEASITCMPVAEMVMGDFSGYIQTNLMAMTDGHLYFDRDYYNQGKRPPINPFLSVTRVGRQAQTPLLRELSRKITSFMVGYEKMKEFMHFGAELSEESQKMLITGDKISSIFEQSSISPRPFSLSILMFTAVWAGYWQEKDINGLKLELKKLSNLYMVNEEFRKQAESTIQNSPSFNHLVDSMKSSQSNILQMLSELK